MPNHEAAKRALDVINNLGGSAEEFRAKWLALHAFSSEFEGNNQRKVLLRSIEQAIPNDEAGEIIDKLEAEIEYLSKNPVGNLELHDTHPDFYQHAKQDITQAQLSNRSPSNRLGHIICVVYQVRCNVEHGRKKLGTERSQKLFSISNEVLDLVMPILTRVSDAA